MDKIINLILYLITFLCLYTILSVGLNLLWKIETSNNAANINQVCLNLSYSYIAGLIFYFFISYLPFLLTAKKLEGTINFKIIDLNKQIESYLQTFSDTEIVCNINSINSRYILKIIKDKNLNDNSYYSEMMGYQINNYQFIYETKSRIFDIINSLLVYKKYLSSNQILILEQIKDSNFFHILKVYNHPQGKDLVKLENFKDQFTNELWLIVRALQNL